MRHSQAVAADFNTRDDARWLTQSGRGLAKEAAGALAGHTSIDCIVSSPCCRAVQTAEIVAHRLGYSGEIEILESLRSESSPQMAVEQLQELPYDKVLALSHEPIVSVLSGLLSQQSPSAQPAGFQTSGFRTAEIRGHLGGVQTWLWRG